MMPGVTNWPAASITVAPGGRGDGGADLGDLAVADQDGSLGDVAVRDGQNGRVLDDDDAGAAGLRDPMPAPMRCTPPEGLSEQESFSC